MNPPGGSAFYETIYKRTLETWSDELENTVHYARKARKVLVEAREHCVPTTTCATCDLPVMPSDWQDGCVRCERCLLVLQCFQLPTCITVREHSMCACPACGTAGCTHCMDPCAICTSLSCAECIVGCKCYYCYLCQTDDTKRQMVCDMCKKECPSCGAYVSINCDFTCC